MYSRQNSNSKKVNFNDKEPAVSINIEDNYDEFSYNEKNVYTDVTSNKKNITYDDILESMCMRVQNGNLCMLKEDLGKHANYLSNKTQNCNQSQSYNKTQTCNKNQTCYKTQTYLNIDDKSVNTLNNNSYIYNKYFQKHKQNDNSGENTIADEIDILKEMLELGQISPQDYNKEVFIKLIEHRNKILYLKKLNSQKKKLLFSTSNINISRNRVNPNNLNKLFNFVGPGPLPYTDNIPPSYNGQK